MHVTGLPVGQTIRAPFSVLVRGDNRRSRTDVLRSLCCRPRRERRQSAFPSATSGAASIDGLAIVKVQPYRYEKIENRRAGGLAEKRARPRHGSGALQGFSRLGTGKEVRGEVLSVTESGTHPKVETGLNDLRAQCALDRRPYL